MLLKSQDFVQACGYDNVNTLDANCMNRWKAREEIACKKLHGKWRLLSNVK